MPYKNAIFVPEVNSLFFMVLKIGFPVECKEKIHDFLRRFRSFQKNMKRNNKIGEYAKCKKNGRFFGGGIHVCAVRRKLPTAQEINQ